MGFEEKVTTFKKERVNSYKVDGDGYTVPQLIDVVENLGEEECIWIPTSKTNPKQEFFKDHILPLAKDPRNEGKKPEDYRIYSVLDVSDAKDIVERVNRLGRIDRSTYGLVWFMPFGWHFAPYTNLVEAYRFRTSIRNKDAIKSAFLKHIEEHEQYRQFEDIVRDMFEEQNLTLKHRISDHYILRSIKQLYDAGDREFVDEFASNFGETGEEVLSNILNAFDIPDGLLKVVLELPRDETHKIFTDIGQSINPNKKFLRLYAKMKEAEEQLEKASSKEEIRNLESQIFHLNEEMDRIEEFRWDLEYEGVEVYAGRALRELGEFYKYENLFGFTVFEAPSSNKFKEGESYSVALVSISDKEDLIFPVNTLTVCKCEDSKFRGRTKFDVFQRDSLEMGQATKYCKHGAQSIAQAIQNGDVQQLPRPSEYLVEILDKLQNRVKGHQFTKTEIDLVIGGVIRKYDFEKCFNYDDIVLDGRIVTASRIAAEKLNVAKLIGMKYLNLVHDMISEEEDRVIRYVDRIDLIKTHAVGNFLTHLIIPRKQVWRFRRLHDDKGHFQKVTPEDTSYKFHQGDYKITRKSARGYKYKIRGMKRKIERLERVESEIEAYLRLAQNSSL